jgi:hypothetical protein
MPFKRCFLPSLATHFTTFSPQKHHEQNPMFSKTPLKNPANGPKNLHVIRQIFPQQNSICIEHSQGSSGKVVAQPE